MEILKSRYTNLVQFLKKLEYITNKFNIYCNKNFLSTEDDEYILYRDALIKRFELCYQLTWKFLKNYLEEKSGIFVASPKEVFQVCLEQKITTIDETEKLIEMVNISNNIYSEEIANQTSKLIADYYQIMSTIIHRIKI